LCCPVILHHLLQSNTQAAMTPWRTVSTNRSCSIHSHMLGTSVYLESISSRVLAMVEYQSLPSEEVESLPQTDTHASDVPATNPSTQDRGSRPHSPDGDGIVLQRGSGSDSSPCVSRYLLVGLAFCFTSLTLTVGLLYHFSQAHSGLTTEKASHRYAWLYGSTAGM
jgi:hypothetical protein